MKQATVGQPVRVPILFFFAIDNKYCCDVTIIILVHILTLILVHILTLIPTLYLMAISAHTKEVLMLYVLSDKHFNKNPNPYLFSSKKWTVLKLAASLLLDSSFRVSKQLFFFAIIIILTLILILTLTLMAILAHKKFLIIYQQKKTKLLPILQ